MRKLFRSSIAFALLIIFLIFQVSAHPGRTDENGGHYNRSTGEYHYHHGYPEHQHTDGVCPYDFVDKTGSYSGGSSGTSAAVIEEPPVANSENEKSTSQFQFCPEDIIWFGPLLIAYFALDIILKRKDQQRMTGRKKMINKRNISEVMWPALALFVVTMLIQSLIEYYSAAYLNTFIFASLAIGCLFSEIFAYITCWAFVFRKSKSHRAVWINYIVWILIMNIGTVYDFLAT